MGSFRHTVLMAGILVGCRVVPPESAPVDADGDGWAVPEDCDDANAAVSPDATEVCDAASVDEDCDGLVDDADPSLDPATVTEWHTDGDGDGFGGDLVAATCAPPTGTTADASDCDDGDVAVNPAATEVCDALDRDEDCDGAADDADPSVDPAGMSSWIVDADGDGYGDDTTVATEACDPVSGQVATAGDCDDRDSAVNPAATEVCDALDVDEDCSGAADDDDPAVDPSSASMWFIDYDDDGYGARGRFDVLACSPPAGWVADDRDCDDIAPAVHPGATEVCDAAATDEDCDGLADDTDPGVTGGATWYADADGDGQGDAGVTIAACAASSGYVGNASDCDDGDPAVFTGAPEVVGDEHDQDCDGGARARSARRRTRCGRVRPPATSVARSRPAITMATASTTWWWGSSTRTAPPVGRTSSTAARASLRRAP